ncbi:MAG: winged helix-turn-helix transcriptional regulator [Anaerolineaceae bacterium]|nr:MAG: winged helix-turn-helix transcriptional regulator [Anaerolineaceae bacterium]
MDDSVRDTRDLTLLEEIERDPDTSQITLATRLGVAVGTVNWHLKRLVAKGYVKVKRAERKKLRYIITPEGIALRARLTVAYVENQMTLYRQVREEAQKVLKTVRKKGFRAVYIVGDGDIADVCRLSCLEHGIPVVEDSKDGSVATLEIKGKQIVLREKKSE